MSHFTPIRDMAGAIVGMQRQAETGFAATLAETMQAVGAAEPEAAEPDAPRSRSRYEAGAFVLGVVLALTLIAALSHTAPTTPAAHAPPQPPAPAPTVPARRADPAPAQRAAYAAPDGAPLGLIPLSATIRYRYGATAWGGVRWQGQIVWVRADPAQLAGLPDLAPPPTPNVVYVPAPAPPPAQCYDVTIDVLDSRGYPAGTATGHSCESQAAAAANAQAQAAEMRQK